VICYHGTPINPISAASVILAERHAMVSFSDTAQMPLVAEICQSFVIDNGAFSHWGKTGQTVDAPAFASFVHEWDRHPGFDWCLIPDKIDGNEFDNDELIREWERLYGHHNSVPVWHLHESIERLDRLSKIWPRVAFGSSGEWPNPGNDKWWDRISAAMDAICDPSGRPRCKIHGLRMMCPTIFSHIPFSSVDSCNIAKNIGIDQRWDNHMYLRGLNKGSRAQVMAARLEAHAAASTWKGRDTQMSFDLLG